MSDQTYRDWWIGQVFRAPSITDSIRVALLALAPEMDASGKVRITRETLAERLGRSERRVTDRIKTAIEACFLVRVSRGQKHATAVYQATTPGVPGGPSAGHPGVSLSADLRRTPGCLPEHSQGDDLQHPESSAQEDPRGSRRTPPVDNLSGTPGGPPERRAPYKARARARSKADHPTEDETQESVSQSAQTREARRLLTGRYGLTDKESDLVIAEVHRRARTPIRALARYLDRMAEGDLADIVGAVMDRDPPADRPPIRAVPDWCGHCDEHTRQVGDPDRPARCPTCHPLRNGAAS